jgi:alkylhydroperoxidase/carboxymuconolactone decarboxylase family protein YurZ
MIEVILQMVVFAGFPAVINALNVAREVFDERGVTVGASNSVLERTRDR